MNFASSLTARLAALFAAMASGLLIVVGLAIDQAVSAHFDELDRIELSAKRSAIETLLESTRTEEALAALPGRIDDALAGHHTVSLRLAIPERNWLHVVLRQGFEGQAEQLASRPGEVISWQDARGAHHIGQALALAVPLSRPEMAQLLLGIDISHHVHFLRTMRLQLGISISAAALLAAMLGWIVARKGLGPLREVTQTVSRLSAERLGERMSSERVPAEMRDLVDAFNGMLERLESSFRRLNEFSADIAHELRTPVSNLMTETQVALSRTRSAEAYCEVLHSNLEEFERLARMIADMLFLAKADNGLLPRGDECVLLQDEAAALLEFYEALAEEKGVYLRMSGAAQVTGDRLMLRRALSNLLSNAIRHAPAGGTVQVGIEALGDRVRVTVSNPGEPVPPDKMALVFDRFFRVDQSRSRQGEGSGLGLAITRSIVQAHGGTIEMSSDAARTVVSVELPATVQAPAMWVPGA